MSLADDPIAALSPREREVLELIAAGRTNVEIANALGIRFDTAKWHVSEVLSKLGVERREDAAKAWRRWNRVHRRLTRALSARFGTAAKVGIGLAAVLALGVVVLAVVALRDSNADEGLSGIFVAHVDLGDGAGDSDAGLRVYNAETGEVILDARNEGRPYVVPRFSPTGGRLAVIRAGAEASASRFITFALSSGDRSESEPMHIAEELGEPIWSPDGTRVAMAAHRLSVLTSDATVLGASDTTPELLNGGRSLGTPTWAPDSQHVAVVLSGSLIVASRDGDILQMDPATLDVAPEIGSVFDIVRDDLFFGAWLGDDSFSVIVRKDGQVPIGRDSNVHLLIVQASLDSLAITWRPPEPLTDHELSRFQSPTVTESEQIVAEATTLVPDADDRLARSVHPWRSADGGAWAVAMPRANDAAASSTVIILLEPPVLLEVPGIVGVLSDHARAVDVVIAE